MIYKHVQYFFFFSVVFLANKLEKLKSHSSLNVLSSSSCCQHRVCMAVCGLCVCVISVAGVTGRHGRYRQEEGRKSTGPWLVGGGFE